MVRVVAALVFDLQVEKAKEGNLERFAAGGGERKGEVLVAAGGG